MVIQRSWKILSESGSTSASSTEANRSPSGLHSSSDDSNCSNQTTHSMVTSVASPPASKFEATSTEAVLAGIAPATVSGGGGGGAGVGSVCEPANRALQKFVTTPQMADAMLQRLRQRLSCPIAGSGATSESAMRSLELLRISVQSAFDKEVDAVVRQFMENYFKPAFKNLKENLGQSAVSEDTLQKMSCALLENAKAQYHAFRLKPQAAYLAAAHTGTTEQAVRMAIKRPASKQIGVAELSKKLFAAAAATSQQALANGAAKATITLAQPALLQQQQQKATNAQSAPTRRQIFWNTANISTATKFVLDVQANQAFGFATDGTERLASKHPELIRYLPDNEDREWLATQSIISPQNKSSRFLFLIHDEVCRLQQSHEAYRSKPNVDLSLMRTFAVPEFMIQKMKLFFVDLNIKSRGLITNSFSVGNPPSANSHLRNALLQGMQTAAATASMPEITGTTTANNSNVSTTSGDAAALVQLKPKTSTLSSSHATLTALLNNSAGSGSNGSCSTPNSSKRQKLDSE